MIRCRVFSSGYQYVRFASTCTQSLITLSSACQATRTVKLLLPSIKLQAASQTSHRYTNLTPKPHTVMYLRALFPCRSLNPKPLQQCISIPTPLYIFQVTWSGPIRLQLCCHLYYIFRVDAGTPPPPPPPPLDPLDPLVRLVPVSYLFVPG